MPLHAFLHSSLNALVQIKNEMGLQNMRIPKDGLQYQEGRKLLSNLEKDGHSKFQMGHWSIQDSKEGNINNKEGGVEYL
jgi:hypothetical protein